MGFVKDLAKVGMFGVTGLALSKKKKPVTPPLQPTMISITPYERPISMIGSPRGG